MAAGLDIQMHAGLTISGAVGTVYSIEYVTDLAQTNDAGAWHCLEFLQLPESPHFWADKSRPATGRRFYRAVFFAAPTNMIFIPPGTFRMGSPTNEEGRLDWEGPETAVTISRGFWMGKHEVTQGEYLAVIGSNPSFFNGLREGWPYTGTNTDFGTVPNRPVEQVNWHDATNYCATLTQQERAAGRIGRNCVYALPTEAEWEYACRAWTSTRFSYGDHPGYSNVVDYAWYSDNSGESSHTTHPVEQKLANRWGLYDMHGNVEEWCQDWLGYYAGGLAVDPQEPPMGSDGRVIRGGSSISGPPGCRSASRNHFYPGYGWSLIGFRVVLAAGQP